MKKIAVTVFLMAICVATARAQESRQDVSISGTALIEPFIASSTNVEISANRAFGALLSYRFMLTPTSAIEANYGVTYQNALHIVPPPNDYMVNTRLHEISAAYVRSFVFKNFNPFVEGGPGIFLFQPIRNSGTQTYDVHRQTQLGAMYGAGIAYEISPSFDIRAEYRGLIVKVPNFNNTQFSTNKWYNIYNPTIGIAYHF